MDLADRPLAHIRSRYASAAGSAGRCAPGGTGAVARRVVSSLHLADTVTLRLAEWSQEALATARIEAETLQINSVRALAARRLGLTQSSRAALKQREPRVEATVD